MNLSPASVAYIPQDAPKGGSGVGEIVMWTGVVCASFVGLLLVVIVIAAAMRESAPASSQRSPVQASDEKTSRAPTVLMDPDPAILSPSDRERLNRWKKTFTHYDTIEAFQQFIDDINADRIISKEEFAHICFALDQWKAQHQAALDHVTEYRRVGPETVTENSGLIEGLEREAQRALNLLDQLEVECK